MKEKIPDRKNEEISRREVFSPKKVLSSLPTVVTHDIRQKKQFETRQSEWIHGGGMRNYKHLVQSEKGKKILEAGSDLEIANLVLRMPFSPTPAMLKNTPYDLDRAFPFFPAFRLCKSEDEDFILERASDSLADGSSGNGCVLTPEIILSARHVINALRLHKLPSSTSRDIAFAEIPSTVVQIPRPEELTRISDITDADLPGRFVVAMGVHRKGDHLDGQKKSWTSTAFPITPRFEKFIEKYGMARFNPFSSVSSDELGGCFAMSIPYAEGRRFFPKGAGMSGAPVFAAFENDGGKEVEYKFAGTIFTGGCIKFGIRKFSFTLFNGIDSIREAMPEEVKRTLAIG